MSTQSLHHALLRPAIIHILRAAGFHSTRPSVLDTLTDLCTRHLMLISSETARAVYDRTSNLPDPDTNRFLDSDTDPQTTPDSPQNDGLHRYPENKTPSILRDLDGAISTISDIRLALTTSAFFAQTLTSTEETWRESLRKPLSFFPTAGREKEARRRDTEDTRDVREFIDWATGPVNREIRRIAGLLVDEGDGEGEGLKRARDDYLMILKKKHSKTGDLARYLGTALGTAGEAKGLLRIEGGPVTLEEVVRKRRLGVGEDGSGSDGSSKRIHSAVSS